jgi:hypothetical protein
MPEAGLVIEIVGEGTADLGRGDDQLKPPTSGVVPIFVHGLCGRPELMQFRRKPLQFLQGKGLWQKVRFAKRQAYYNRSAGLVFVKDTEGDHPRQLQELQRGRDFELPQYPAAVGVAHPCIEAWLLTDASAIKRAIGLAQQPDVPADPELLPPPRRDRVQNPKVVLGRCAGKNQPLSSEKASKIANEIRDLNAVRTRCPISFAPFADEVIERIRPLFRRDASEPREH